MRVSGRDPENLGQTDQRTEPAIAPADVAQSPQDHNGHARMDCCVLKVS